MEKEEEEEGVFIYRPMRRSSCVARRVCESSIATPFSSSSSAMESVWVDSAMESRSSRGARSHSSSSSSCSFKPAARSKRRLSQKSQPWPGLWPRTCVVSSCPASDT